MILESFEHELEAVTLVPSLGGVFEVVLDGDLIFSKKATGRHAEYEEVLVALRSKIRT